MDPSEKKCPFCAEMIQSEAVVCRFCGRDLSEKHQPKTSPAVVVLAVFFGVMFLIIIIVGGSSDSYPTTSRPAQKRNLGTTKEWYEGGTLHRATIAEWLKASSRNQLATSADWALVVYERAGRTITSTDQLRVLAEQLKICVSEASLGDPTQSLKVAELAAACSILLGHK